MFSELVKRNSRRSRRENGLFFASLLIAIIAFYIILSLSHQDVIVFLKTMESDAVNRLLTLVPALYVMTLCILFFLVYYANRFQLARRRHEFGVYLMLGMQRRTLFGMLLAEDLRSSVIALAIGLACWAFFTFSALPTQFREWKAAEIAKSGLKEAGLWPVLPSDAMAVEQCLKALSWCHVAGFRRILPR